MRSLGTCDVIYLKNEELLIHYGKQSSRAKLNANFAHNIPNETTIQKHADGNLYYPGGSDSNFNCDLFEVYGIEI